MPGKSLAPAFAKDNTVTHDFFWWYHKGTRAFRIGDWKLVADNNAPWELYDLHTDRAESKNLAAQQPERVKELEKEWTKRAEEFRTLANQDAPPTKDKAKL
ncbi:MAG: hypothetical protein NTZ16_04275 [Verrucomicrobia bacterium]|nr:hypothetical protein [Verrucomicrobiota bacterium]